MAALKEFAYRFYALGVIDNSWPKVEGDESCNSPYMHMEFNSLSDYEQSLKLLTFVVLLFLCD